jgi:GNAT superfamily N-acetyltransferase
MNIRQANKTEYPQVEQHYALCGYRGGIGDDDLVIVSPEGEAIVGAVRICFENGERVLRGMHIQPAYQGNGLGKAMLEYVALHVGLHGCYCLPHAHLRLFYGHVGFREIEEDGAPEFLVRRLRGYREAGHPTLIIMKSF